MARLQNGLFGGFKGRIGDVEGFIRNGVPFIRVKKRKSKAAPSLKQQIQRKNMTVVNKLIDSMTAFVKLGFSGVAKGQTFSANNAAKSYQLTNALTGEYPDIRIDYPSVRLASGKLIMPEVIDAFWDGMGIRFTWIFNEMINWNERRSRAMVLVHEPETQKSYYHLVSAAMQEETQFIELPADFAGKPLHGYLSFVSEDQKRIGNSHYFYIT